MIYVNSLGSNLTCEKIAALHYIYYESCINHYVLKPASPVMETTLCHWAGEVEGK